MDAERSHHLTVVVRLPWCMSVGCSGAYEERYVSMGSGEGREAGKAAKAGLTVAGVGDPSWCTARHDAKQLAV